MNKLKFYMWNAFFSSLIGLAVFVLYLLNWGWHNSFGKLIFALLNNPFQILLQLFCNILYFMTVGAIIGTVSLFFVFQIYSRLSQRPLMGLICNFLVLAVLNIVGGVAQGAQNYRQFVQSAWFWALLVSEVLSIFLIYTWYKRMMFYKVKLEQKKASLRKDGDS
jgi:hypothetical protein